MDIFNPSICLATELKNSWCVNIITRESSDKVPVEMVSGIPRIKAEYDERSKEDWFAMALPLNSDWSPQDISELSELKFVFFSDSHSGGLVRIEDEHGVESEDFILDNSKFKVGTESTICIDLNKEFLGKINAKKVRVVKFIGFSASAFYLSELCVE